VVSPHLISLLIDVTVILLQSSSDHTLVIEGSAPPIPVITHPIQPIIKELVIPMQSLVNPTLLVESDDSVNHVINIPDLAPFEGERVLLSSSPLPPSFEETTFN
jgi:hypothetical protein